MFQPKRLHIVHPVRKPSNEQGGRPCVFLILLFSIGALLGSVFAALGGGHPHLAEQLSSFFQSVAQNSLSRASLWSTIWEALCWPLLLILLSFGPPGIVGIPCVFLVRGFLLSYACSSFVAMFGLPGLGWNLVFFGLSAWFLLPVFLSVGTWAFSCACRHYLFKETSFSKPSSSVLLYCGTLLVLFLLLQSQILPIWLPELCKKILSMQG